MPEVAFTDLLVIRWRWECGTADPNGRAAAYSAPVARVAEQM